MAVPFARMPGALRTVARDEARARSAVPAEPTAVANVRLRVLVVDDDAALRSTCSSLLKLSGYDVTLASRGQEALDLLRRCGYDIVLVDLQMTHVDGLALLRTALATRRDTIVIVMTDNPSLDSCIEALRQGAWDYLPKPFSAAHLQILVGRAAHTLQIAHQARDIESGATEAPNPSDALTLLGTAPAFRRTIELAKKVAQTDASVFITGESGSGKELIAQYIHRQSQRAGQPFVAINCAALPEALLESEMFGHRKGAFTGAVRDKPGLLEAAHGGTLFLDELIEMPKSIQAKLLRVLQDGIVRRVGSETTDAVVDVRFIAATNGDPEASIAAGALREDLYYRLCVVPLQVPPLRDRPEDIPPLAEYFLATFWSRHRGRQATFPRFSDAAIRALVANSWRGNVRELQNLIEKVAVVVEPGTMIRPQDLGFAPDPASVAEPEPMCEVASPAPEPEMSAPVDVPAAVPSPVAVVTAPAPQDAALAPAPAPPSVTVDAGQPPAPPDANPASLISTLLEESYHAARDRVIQQFEMQYLLWLVNRAQGNLAEAARIAGVNRTTLYRMMERNGLQRAPSLGWLTEVEAHESSEHHDGDGRSVAASSSPASDA
ncbi:MAG TPA: sigma-54 dependent transcriptional regulator [Gemmatimonadales bacterium]|nr:sigma-54 dependent transcriptional regulator [Gemmatimonadales bacterium]